MTDDMMENPVIAANMALVPMPEYLYDMLRSEDPEG